jgi:hypothetical protein
MLRSCVIFLEHVSQFFPLLGTWQQTFYRSACCAMLASATSPYRHCGATVIITSDRLVQSVLATDEPQQFCIKIINATICLALRCLMEHIMSNCLINSLHLLINFGSYYLLCFAYKNKNFPWRTWQYIKFRECSFALSEGHRVRLTNNKRPRKISGLKGRK